MAEKVKIKRVKKLKKTITGKQKLLAGLGVGSALLGMAGGGGGGAQNKQSPIVRKQETEKGSVKEKVKKALSKIFGIPEAKAFISTNNPCAPLDNPFAVTGNPWGWWNDWQNSGGGGSGDNFGGGGGGGGSVATLIIEDHRTMIAGQLFGTFSTGDGKWHHSLWGMNVNFNTEAEAVAAADAALAPATQAPPAIELIGGDNIKINKGETFNDPGARATDVDGSSLVAYSSSNINIYEAGIYTVTYTAVSEINGKSASISRTVEVQLNPNVTSGLVLPGEEGQTGFREIGGTDKDGNSLYGFFENNERADNKIYIKSGNGFVEVSPGALSAGNTATRALPTIVLNGSSILTVRQNTAFVDPGATSEDADGNPLTVEVSGNVDTHYPGSNTLTYTARDYYGKTATATRTVDVIAATGNITVRVNGAASMTLTVGQDYYEQGAVAENSSGEGVRDITKSGDVDTGKPGVYVITYTARDDSGNTGIATRTVTVIARRTENEQSPAIRLIGEAYVVVNPGETFNDLGAIATDVDGRSLDAPPDRNVDLSKPGITTITYEAVSEINGKSASISRTVHVLPANTPNISSLKSPFTADGRPVTWDENGNGWAKGADGQLELVGQNGQLLPATPFITVSATNINPGNLTPVSGHEGLYTDGTNLYAFDNDGKPVLQGTLQDLRDLETPELPQGPTIPVNPFVNPNPFAGQTTVIPSYVPPVTVGQPLPVNSYANLFGNQNITPVPSVISGQPIYREIPLPNGNVAWTVNGTDYFDGSNVYKYDPAQSSDILWLNPATNKFEPSSMARALSIAALDQQTRSESDSSASLTGKAKDKAQAVAGQIGKTGKSVVSRAVDIFKKDDSSKPDSLNLDPSRLKSLATAGVTAGVSMVSAPAGGRAVGVLMGDQGKWDKLVDWATNPDKIDRDGYVTFTNPDTGQKERWSKSDVQNMLAFLQAQGLKP